MFARGGINATTSFVRHVSKGISTSSRVLAKDYYSILKVPKTATAKEIKSAYLTLAKKYHPDKNNQDAAATKTFHDISEAYDVLGNKQRRENYDLNGQFTNNNFSSHNTNPFTHTSQQWNPNQGNYQTHWKFTSNMNGKEADEIFKEMFKEMQKAQMSGQFGSFNKGQRDGSAPFNMFAQEIGKKIMEEMMKPGGQQQQQQSNFFKDVFKFMKKK